jgi:tetratricopeptide (TPR) repeat protein
VVGELTPSQKFDLLTQIMQQDKDCKLPKVENKELMEFLKQLPPFPLDISTAAYYLKTLNVSYNEYLKSLKQQDKDFTIVQENLLREAGEYKKTRYAIITRSLEHIINEHKDFAELLLFIILIDSQNIPKELFRLYKNPSIVDNFIYHLKKHSLIEIQSLSSVPEPIYSIHRSTQAIALSYLTKSLKLNKDSTALKEIVHALDAYADKNVEHEDFPRMHIVARHLEKILSCPHLLTDFSKGLLESKLGSVYYFINNDKYKEVLVSSYKILKTKNLEQISSEDISKLARSLLHIGVVYTELRLDKEAQRVLENAVSIYRRDETKNYADLSRALSYVGNIHRKLGNYQKAKNYLKESLHLHKQYNSNNKHMARTLAYLGATYRGLGAYQESMDALKESLALHKKNYSDDHFRAGWILVQLGKVYRDLGNPQKAKEYLENGLLVLQRCLHDHHVNIGIALAYLGNCYRELGEYEKSRSYLEQSLKIHQKHFDKNHVKMGWILFHLASTYKAIGRYQEAQKLFTVVFKIYSNHCNEENIETAKILRSMAKIFLEKNHLDEAENFIKRSLKILNSHHHVEAYKSLKTLGEIYFKKAVEPTYAKTNQEHAYLEKQALDAFNQALAIAKQNLPSGSIHIEKIHARLKRIQQKN